MFDDHPQFMWGIKVFVFFGLVMAILSCAEDKNIKTLEKSARPVKLIQIDHADSRRSFKFPAVVGANRMSELAFQVSGIVEQLPIKESQRVERGDLIVGLRSRDFKNALEAAKAEFENLDSEYERAQKLASQKLISLSVLEQKQTQRDIAKVKLSDAKNTLDDSSVHAPYDGVVAQIMVQKLQNVSAGEIAVTLLDTQSLEATIDLPASFIARVPKSDKNKDKIFVVLDVAPNQLIEAEFKEASLVADSASQTYAVTFSFRQPANLNVLPGMNATVELSFGSRSQQNRFSIPLSAILSEAEAQFVWVASVVEGTNEYSVSKRQVTIEAGVGEQVIVTGGLKLGETVVGAGAAYLSEGMNVVRWKKP